VRFWNGLEQLRRGQCQGFGYNSDKPSHSEIKKAGNLC